MRGCYRAGGRPDRGVGRFATDPGRMLDIGVSEEGGMGIHSEVAGWSCGSKDTPRAGHPLISVQHNLEPEQPVTFRPQSHGLTSPAKDLLRLLCSGICICPIIAPGCLTPPVAAAWRFHDPSKLCCGEVLLRSHSCLN